MARLKTAPTGESVEQFLQEITDEGQREDCRSLVKLMRAITGDPPRMWGASIVGFGSYHYRYASGREGDWFLTGFSPRKKNLTLYIMSGFAGYEALLKKLGKHRTGKSCLYVKRLSDLDPATLRELIAQSVKHVAQRYP